MAEIDNNNATFNEVLSVSVDTAKFAQGLSELKRLYAQFLADMGGNAGNVIGAGSFAGLQQELRAMSQAMSQFQAEMLVSQNEITQAVLKSVDRQDDAEETLHRKRRQRAKETAEDQVRGRDKVADNIDIEQEGLSNKADQDTLKAFEQEEVRHKRAIDRIRELEVEQEGLVNEANERTRRAFEIEEDLHQKRLARTRDIAIEQEGLINQADQDTIKAFENEQKLHAAREKALLKEKELRDARIRFARNLDIEQEGLAEKADLDTRKAFEREEQLHRQRLNFQRSLDIEREGINNRADEDTLKAFQKEEELHQRRLKFKRDLEIEQEGEVNRNLEQSQREQARIAAAGQLEYNRQLRQTEAQQAKLAKQNQSLFSSVASGFRGALIHLVKFYSAWLLIQAVIDSVFYTIDLIFLSVREGIQHLRDTETAADDLVGVLHSNVQFSADLAENFVKSQEAAHELVEELQQSAVRLGVPFDKIFSTFKALTTGGAPALVKNMRDMVQLAEVFQITLKAAGVGDLAAQGSIAQITQLLSGDAKPNDAFLRALGLSSDEWKNIVDRSKQHHDLVGELQPRIEPYLKALEKAQLSSRVLSDNFDLLRKRVEAVAVKPIFDAMNSLLRLVNAFLTENGDQLAAWFRIWLNGALSIARAFKTVFSTISLGSVVKGVLQNIALTTASIGVAAEFAGASFKLLLGLMTSVANFDANKAREELSAFSDALVELEKNRRKTLEDLAIAFGRAEARKGFKSGILDREILSKNPPVPGKSDLDRSRDLFRDEVDEIERNAQRIKEVYDELKERTDRFVEDRRISLQTGADNVRALVEQERGYYEKFQQQIAEVSAKARSLIVSDKGLNADERANALRDLDNSTQDALERLRKQAQSAKKDTTDADRKLDKDRLAQLQQEIEARGNLREQEVEHDKALVEEAASFGLLTARQRFDLEAELAERSHEYRLELLRAELEAAGANVTEQKKALQEIALEEGRFAKHKELLAAQQQRINEEEQKQRVDHALQMRALVLEAQSLSGEITRELRPAAGFDSIGDNLLQARERELEIVQRQVEAELRLATAKNAESEETRALTRELQGLHNERLRLIAERLRGAGSVDPAFRRGIQQSIINQERASLQASVAERRDRLDNFNFANPGFTEDAAIIAKRQEMVRELEEAQQSLDGFEKSVEGGALSLRRAGETFADALFGAGIVEAWGLAEGGMQKFSVAVAAGANALTSILNVVGTFKRGRQEGGTLGGIGAVFGSFSGVLGAIPGAGPFLQAIGPVLSFIGSMFTGAAKRIAEDVKKSFQKTLDQFQNGNATLQDTIRALESERLNAITRLSGKKGGKDELNKLLPDFDREIEQLKKKQQEILLDFDTQLDALREQSETLAQIKKQWADINKVVKEYIGAGGDANKAAEFLSLHLAKIQDQAIEELARAEQDAIDSMLRLNGLLEERNRLVDDFKQKEFDLINADSIERRQAGSVARGRELEKLRKQHEESLARIDSEIKGVTTRAEREREIFDLTSDVALLRRRSDELSLIALDKQIEKLRDLKAIAQGITIGENGLLSGAGLGLNPTGLNITININGPIGPGIDPRDFGREIGDGINDELDRNLRFTIA